MNVSPATLLTRSASHLLGRLPLRRVLLELSEHDQVEDYDALTATLAPFRAGASGWRSTTSAPGFSSLRHIVVTAPDVIKIDRSIVAGLDTDPVLTKLVQSLVEFGHGCHVRVVAEGVETAGEAAVLRTLGSTTDRAGTSAVPARPRRWPTSLADRAARRPPGCRGPVCPPEPGAAGRAPPVVGLGPVHGPVGAADQVVRGVPGRPTATPTLTPIDSSPPGPGNGWATPSRPAGRARPARPRRAPGTG